MENSIKNIRKLSFNILYDVLINKKLLNNVLNECFDKNDLTDENKAFIKRECTGVVEKINDIDAIINKYSKVKTNKLNNDILVVLRLATYEIYYMDSVPNYATINESVNIIKKSKSSKLSGYVNAVLRNIIRNENTKESKEIVAKKCYFKVCNDGVGKVTSELENKNIFYDTYIGKLTFKNAKVYYTNSYKEITDLESFKKGYVLIEDASSIHLVDRLVSIIKTKWNDAKLQILDTCSAPGGKIISLMDMLGVNAYAKAFDISNEKIEKIIENIDRVKIKNIEVGVKDATVLCNELVNKYEVVLCDVPCTGLGVVEKKPDIKLNYSDDKRDSLVKIQRLILDVSKEYVKSGGILSYSTCTTTKEENEDNIKYFLDSNKGFKVLYEKRMDINDENNADGFYMCIMEKN